MRYCRFLYLAVVILLNIPSLSAQTEGREFWFTCGMKPEIWPDAGVEPSDSAIIYILGNQSCTGYVQNPYSSFYVSFDVYPDTLITVTVPADELFYVDHPFLFPFRAVQGATIVIRTTEDVQVWCQSPRFTEFFSQETTNFMHFDYPFKVQLIPTNLYGKQYNIPPFDLGIFSYVIAVTDSTQVFFNNDTVLLNTGEFCVIDNSYGKSIRTNCKKIIVYTGYDITTSYGAVPESSVQYGTDYLVRALKNKLFYLDYSVINRNSTTDEMLDVISYPTPNNSTFFSYHNNYHYQNSSDPMLDSIIYAYCLLDSPVGAWYRISHSPSYTISYPDLIKSMEMRVHPTEKMTTHWDYPITKNKFQLSAPPIDTTYVDLTIYVHENGITTTSLNGQLIPPDAFDPFPMTNGVYYSTQFAWYSSDSLPDYITIDNPNGFTGYINEIGYSYTNFYYPPELNPRPRPYYFIGNSSPYNYLESPYPHSNLSVVDSDTVYRCLGDTLDLLVEHNPESVPVEWIVDGIPHTGDSYSFLLADLDTLTVQCVLHYDCPDTTTTFIAVVPPPLLTIAHDTTVCAGAILSVEQSNVLSYLWSNGATTPSITVNSAGTFQVSVVNIGCRAESGSFNVSLYGQSSVDFGHDSILCELATLRLDATQPHPAQYLWQDASTNTTYTVYQDGEYWVVITDNCLGASDTINIGYLNDFTVSLGPDTTLCEGKTLNLSVKAPFCDYLWQDGSTQPEYVVSVPGMYSVEVSNHCFRHWDAVNVDYEQCEQELYLPNAIVFGRPGKNGVFLPVFSYPDEVEEYRMEIYNRWGALVFLSEDLTFGWNGINAIVGVYAVVIHYKTRGEKKKTVKGSVTVIR
jgi:hypothetical protein